MSVSRHCSIYSDVKGDWYLEFANRENGERGEADLYGPFNSKDEVQSYLRGNFSNPGGFSFYEDAVTPTKAPNGSDIIHPRQRRW